MSKHILFLIHGMGEHQASEWHLPIVSKLCDTFKTYNAFQNNGTTLEELVDFVPITYDHIFTDVLETWQQNPSKILAIPPQAHFTPLNIVSWLSNASQKEKSFFWSHIADVLIYRFMQDEQEQVRMSVINQLKSRLSCETEPPVCSILAHNLGTAVIHDSLHLLYSTPWNNKPTYFNQQYKFQNMTMLANTSRVMTSNVPDQGSFYDKVYYQSLAKPDGAVINYINCRHMFDPIPSWIYRFNPPWPVNEQYQNIRIDHVSQADINDFEHYLDNPAVHIPLFRSILGKFAISKAEYDQKVAAFKAGHQLSLSVFNPKLKQLIDQKMEAETDQHIGGFIEVLQAYAGTLPAETHPKPFMQMKRNPLLNTI